MATRRGGLNKGKGLESLIPQKKTGSPAKKDLEDKADSGKTEAVREKVVEKIVEKVVEKPVEQTLRLSQLVPNKDQPRREFDEDSLQELAESIKQHGLIQPILVMKKGRYYEIIAGERRWRAAKLAGLKTVPVVIREYSPREQMEIALIENLQRENLNVIEEAFAYQKLLEEYQMKQEELAERLSRSRTAITNTLRLLKLEERVQTLLKENRISSGHARALLALEDPAQQYAYAMLIVERGWSVRETEKQVKRASAEAKKEKKEADPQLQAILQDLEEKLKQSLGTKVNIHTKKAGKGSIEIEYYSEDEMERILHLLQSAGEQM